MSNRVVHFEIQVDEPQRAINFYKSVFGWEFIKWEGSDTEYYMIMTAPSDSKESGINGGLLKRPKPKPGKDLGTNAFVCTVQVDDYDDIEKKIIEGGGITVLPKTALTGMAWQGYYLDTQGNVFGIHSEDKKAK